jgi:hypothetical protein
VDLNPSGFSIVRAYGVSDGKQVGVGSGIATGGYYHALLWSGTAASYVDLNPSGFDYSVADAVSGGQQVGYGFGSATGGNVHALLWLGTAASYLDLSTFLPAGYNSAEALGVDSAGNIVGWAEAGGVYRAVLWQHEPGEPLPGPSVVPVPVPGAALLGVIGLSFAGWRLRRRGTV